MSSAKENLKRHNQHGNFTKQDTSHIKNVSLVNTHYLMHCDQCGWHGWVIKTLIDTP